MTTVNLNSRKATGLRWAQLAVAKKSEIPGVGSWAADVEDGDGYSYVIKIIPPSSLQMGTWKVEISVVEVDKTADREWADAGHAYKPSSLYVYLPPPDDRLYYAANVRPNNTLEVWKMTD